MKKSKNRCKTWIRALSCVILLLIGVIAAVAIDYFWGDIDNICVAIMLELAFTVITVFGVSGLWEVLGKRAFAEEVLELAGIASNLQQSGIVGFYEKFTDIKWSEIFEGTKEVSLMFTYAYSWRNNNRQELKDVSSKKNSRLIVLLPDYSIPEVCDMCDRDFLYGKHAEDGSENVQKNTESKIKKAIEDFKKLNADIYLYPSNLKTTYYFFDDKCIIAPFKHGKDKYCVPAILCREGGALYEFCKNDLEQAIKKSRKEQ